MKISEALESIIDFIKESWKGALILLNFVLSFFLVLSILKVYGPNPLNILRFIYTSLVGFR